MARRAQHAFVTKEQEAALLTRWRERKDERAMQAVILAHDAQVRKIAMNYRGWADMDDLVQEGFIGLLKAADKFDLSVGVRFSTYAQWWVRAEMQSYVISHHSVVRGRRKNGAPLVTHQDIGIDHQLSDGRTLLDTLVFEGRSPEEIAALAVDSERLETAMRKLKPRERSVLRKRYDDRTLESIAGPLGISKERVRQIEAGGIAKLRSLLADYNPMQERA